MNYPPHSIHYWDNNPPPPGTEFDEVEPLPTSSMTERTTEKNAINSVPDLVPELAIVQPQSKSKEEKSKDVVSSKNCSPQRDRNKSSERSRRYRSHSRSGDRKHYRRRSRSRRRSSRDRRKRSRSRSYSRSRSKERRSGSHRSRSHTRRRHSDSHSKSRSRSRSAGHRRHKKSHRRRYSRSYSRSRSRSYSSRSHKRDKYRSPSCSPRVKDEFDDGEYSGCYEGELIEEGVQPEQPENNLIPFKNDGSFLEMFKKMQEIQQQQDQQQQIKEEPAAVSQLKKPMLSMVGRRRGGKILKTGLVQKIRNVEDDVSTSSDPWSVYMKEVRKYKEVHCDDDSKTRPLVK